MMQFLSNARSWWVGTRRPSSSMLFGARLTVRGAFLWHAVVVVFWVLAIGLAGGLE